MIKGVSIKGGLPLLSLISVVIVLPNLVNMIDFLFPQWIMGSRWEKCHLASWPGDRRVVLSSVILELEFI
jgi:hypothetical protein